MMIFLNEFSKLNPMPRIAAEAFTKLVAPYAPHIAEELWEILGNQAPVSLADWPGYDESLLAKEEAEILVQVLGKPKARIMMPVDATQEEMLKLAMDDPKIQEVIAGKTLVKSICVPGRIVNLVVKSNEKGPVDQCRSSRSLFRRKTPAGRRGGSRRHPPFRLRAGPSERISDFC
jgi:leucyl-tRNA synthetase